MDAVRMPVFWCLTWYSHTYWVLTRIKAQNKNRAETDSVRTSVTHWNLKMQNVSLCSGPKLTMFDSISRQPVCPFKSSYNKSVPERSQLMITTQHDCALGKMLRQASALFCFCFYPSVLSSTVAQHSNSTKHTNCICTCSWSENVKQV